MSDFDPGGFIILGTDDFVAGVKNELDRVLHNPVGRLLLEFIEVNPKYIRIVTKTDEHPITEAKTDNVHDSSPKGVVPYMGAADGQYLHRDARGRLVPSDRTDQYDWKGTGEGSDVHIYYKSEPARPNGAYGSKADEVLCHELVHAYRQMEGLDNPVPLTTKDLWLYRNEEEWLAILVTNIYVAAKNSHQNQLRADSQGHTELKAPLNSSVGFLKHPDHRKLVQKYWLQETALFLGLANVFAPWNPIYEFVSDLGKYNQP